jgi:hypothetical protein
VGYSLIEALSLSSGRYRLRLRVAAAVAALLGGLVSCARGGQPPESAAPALPSYGALIEELSEPAGYFDTDNLISNEASFLQVADHLEPGSIGRGGAYLGVGPDQNFTYAARLRPRWAFIVDVRRQNLVQHLLFRFLFENSPTPFEYLKLLFSLDCADAPLGIVGEDPEILIAALESCEPDRVSLERHLAAAVRFIEGDLGMRLSGEDREGLRSILDAFFSAQLDLRFHSYGRPPMHFYPSFRQLLLSRSPSGRRSHFLTSADDYAFVRELARSGRLVPVVGDLSGPKALREIARLLRQQGESVSAFYTSNVEFYLMRSGRYADFVANVEALPLRQESLFIRAYFDYGMQHPARLPGMRSTTLLQRIPDFLSLYRRGAYRSYWDVCTLDYVKQIPPPGGTPRP